jgi:hypothetical protein
MFAGCWHPHDDHTALVSLQAMAYQWMPLNGFRRMEKVGIDMVTECYCQGLQQQTPGKVESHDNPILS